VQARVKEVVLLCSAVGEKVGGTVVRTGEVSGKKMGGNLTSNKYRVILPQCAAYQTRAYQPMLSLFTLPNMSGLHCIRHA
jgi:hypothetical protein